MKANTISVLIQALAKYKKLDVDAIGVCVRAAGEKTLNEWLNNPAIIAEMGRIRVKNAADEAQACANLKIDAATMIITREEINNPSAVQRARITWEAVQAEIARFHAENERIRDDEYDQAFNKLGEINKARAVNLAKRHEREMVEERKRAYASIEAEVARIRAEKATKYADVVGKCL